MKRPIAILALVVSAAYGVAQSASVAGAWRGVRTSPDGCVFSAEMTLETGPSCKMCAAVGSGSIRGVIVWTLRKAGAKADPGFAKGLGSSGTEYVTGEMSADGLLTLRGYRKDDPLNLIDLDRYRLVLGENGNVLGGLTANHGAWTGQFIAMRSQ